MAHLIGFLNRQCYVNPKYLKNSSCTAKIYWHCHVISLFSLPSTFNQRLVLGTDDLLAERGNDLLLVLAERRLAVADARGEALGEGGGALQRRRVAVQVDQRHAGYLPHCVP